MSARVVSDGDDGLRNLMQTSMGKHVQSQLDWLHIGMRLERAFALSVRATAKSLRSKGRR
jgi:hypothetical protein